MIDWLILVGALVLVALCVWVSVRVTDRAIASMDLGDLTDDEGTE
jgi:hypothetical protein